MATFSYIERKKGTVVKAVIRKNGYRRITKTFSGITLATKWARQIEASMENGSYKEEIIASNDKKVKVETIENLIKFFRENVDPTRYSSDVKNYYMYNWWTERIGHIKVKDIKAKDLSACKQILLTEISKYGKPRQANTINKYLMCMSAILTYARDELELIEYNPMSKVKIIPKPEGRKRYLTQEELSRYLSACKNHSKIVYLFVLIALATGGRYSEVLHLRAEDVDYQNERVYYLDTKNGTSRGVYLETDILAFLKEYCDEQGIEKGYIFAGKRKGCLTYIRGELYKVIRNIQLEDFRVHDMRHTFASYSAMNGATLLDIAELLGQKSLTVTRRYSHLTQKHTDAIVKKVVKKIIPTI